MKKIIFILILVFNLRAYSQLDLVWDKTFPDSINIEFAKFSQDGKYIYVATNGNIKKMDAISGEIISSFYNRNVPIYYLNISKSGNYLISRDGGWGFDIWDLKLERIIKHYSGHYRNIFISNDDKYKIFVDAEGLIKITDFQTDTVIKQIQTHSIQSAVMSNNGKMLAIGSTYKKWNQNQVLEDYCKIEIWDTDKLEMMKVLQDTKGSYEGYKDFDFCYGDTILASTPFIAYKTYFFNIKDNKLIEISEIGKGVNNFNYTPNNARLFLWASDTFEVNYSENQKKLYYGYGNILESAGSSESWNVLWGHSNIFKLYKNSITNVGEDNQQNRFIISPNPASDYILINVGAGSKPALVEEIEIFNIFGELEELPRPSGTPSKEGEVRLDVSNLAPGVYFVRVGGKFEKFVKM